MDWIRSFYEAARVEARRKSMEMPVFEVFWQIDDALAFPITAEGRSFIQHEDFRDDPLLNPLGAAWGRIEIFSNTIAKMNYDDCSPHPASMERIERLGAHHQLSAAHRFEPSEIPTASPALRHAAALSTASGSLRFQRRSAALHNRRDRAHIDDDLARCRPLGDPMFVEQHRRHIGRILLSALRKVIAGVPLIPGLKTLIARQTGDSLGPTFGRYRSNSRPRLRRNCS
jgi:hypothetical protein